MPTTEVSWESILKSSLGLQRLLPGSHEATLALYGNEGLYRFIWYRLPLADCKLERFSLSMAVGERHGLVLSLRGRTRTADAEVVGYFHAVWRSYYDVPLSKGRVTRFFTPRPKAIYILVPTNVVSSTEYILDPLSKGGSSRVLFLDQPSIPRLLAGVHGSLSTAVSRAQSVTSRVGLNMGGFNRYRVPRVNPLVVTQSYTNDEFRPNFSTSSVGLKVVLTRSFAGTRTPNFGTLKKGQLPVNNYNLSLVKITDGPSASLLDRTDGFFIHSYYGNSAFTAFDPPTPKPGIVGLRNKTVNTLIRRAGSDIQINLAQDIAQFSQIVQLIGGNARLIAWSLSALRQGNWNSAVTILAKGDPRRADRMQRNRPIESSLASRWLEIQYGWKILLNEIDSAMKLAAYRIVNKPPVRLVRASSTEERDYPFSFRPMFDSKAPLVTASQRQTHVNKIVLKYQLESEVIAYFAQLGFTNPVLLAHEILPWSFVGDWFLPLGPYLSALSAWHGMRFVDGSETDFLREFTDVTFDVKYYEAIPFQIPANKRFQSVYRREYVSHKRVRLNSFPFMDLPRFKSPVNDKVGDAVTRAISAVSLVVQAFAGKR